MGTPSSGTLTSCTGLPISTGVSGLASGVATVLAAGLTGTGNLVAATSPTITGATLTTSTINGLTVTSSTGTLTIANGKTHVVSNSITLAGTDSTTMTFPSTTATIARTDAANTFTGTQTFGALVYTTLNGNTWATGTGTLSIAAGKTFTASNSITLAGTDSTTMTFPGTSATIARTDAANTFTGHQTIEGVTSTGATGTGNLMFSASPTTTGTLTAAAANFSGTVAPAGLLDCSGAAAGQIKFPSTQNNSSNVNTLDDYSEGTFTPTDVSGGALTFSVANGFYTKIGNTVNISGFITYPSTADTSNGAIGGLPFAVRNTGTNGFPFLIYITSYAAVAMGFFTKGAANFTTLSAGSGNAITNIGLSGGNVYFSGTYQVAT